MPDKILFCNELKINALYSIIPQFGNIKVNKCGNMGNFLPIILRGCSDFGWAAFPKSEIPYPNYTEGGVSFLRTFFLAKSNVIFEVGTMLPSKNPHGFRGSILSKMTFTIAVNGMERNMPGTPHNAAPTNTTMMDIKAFIFTLEATM